jgi:transglutaminase-like putative cysteine protease
MSASHSIQAAGLLARRDHRHPRAAGPLLPTAAARLLGFAGLASFGALQWGRLVAPGAGAAMVAALAAAVLAGAALAAVARARVPARRRWAAGVVAAALLLLVALAGAGVPARLVDPRGWGELARGIGDGLSAVPSVTVPYQGDEVWTRAVLILGGAALIGLAALLAFWPRRDGRLGAPVAAAVALGTLYAAPVIQRHADRPFVSGLTFVLLLAVFLWLEHVERRNGGLAAGIVAAAALAGLAAAPQLDGARALLDYEQLAQSLSGAKAASYSWNHSYGPLDWPRDGREVLRVRAPQRAYWKAVNLTAFDGRRWVEDSGRLGLGADVKVTGSSDWVQEIRVTVRALRSAQYVAAGTTLSIADGEGSPGVAPEVAARSGRVLTRGQSYRALVYVPRPTAGQLRAAGTDYPAPLHADYGFLRVPVSVPGYPAQEQVVPIPFWGSPPDPRQSDLTRAFAGSSYAGVFALAQRLRAQSANPYEFVRAVERYLTRGFAYSETPPPSVKPLVDFLLRDKVGYCQQFSGAMALLLRMGGLPARVAAGFAPGAVDDKRKDYIVRDIDAHSWVEVYFPGIGWVTRDPTPSASPARSQTADLTATAQASNATIGGGSERALGGSTDRGRGVTPAAPAAGQGSSSSLLAAVAEGLAGLLLAALAILLWRKRRRPVAQDELAELRRALQRSGRAPRPDLTLDRLAAGLKGSAAEGYVRTLRDARYGYEAARPTREERAALRRELAAGLGLRGRLRSWWALPPRPPSARSRG